MGQADATASLRSDPPVLDGERARSALILVLRGDRPAEPGQAFSLTDMDSVTIGRGDGRVAATRDACGRHLSIAVPDRHVSGCHVRLLRLAHGEWIAEDAGSKNGTALNGSRCDRAPIVDGDLLEVGRSAFLYRVFAGGDPEPAPPLDALATLRRPLAADYAALARVASSRLSILILGETGVGKEVVARAVHELSGRRGPFAPVNCGALPPNLVESTLFGHRRGAFSGASESQPGVVRSAEGGTLFLDEIGELPPTAQASLLRVLQEREVTPVGESRAARVDVRFVAATHRDLSAAIAAGRFREDLYARLTGLTVRIPPLRERREDLGLLIAALLRRVAPDPARVRLAPRAARALLRYTWPRNVRELETCLSAAVLLAGDGEIDLPHLPREIAAATPPDRAADAAPTDDPPAEAAPADAAPADTAPTDEIDRAEDVAALFDRHRGNISAVARAMATSRTQVRRLLKRHGFAAPRRETGGDD